MAESEASDQCSAEIKLLSGRIIIRLSKVDILITFFYEQAIVEFYHTADGRQKAHTWLSSIQCSPDAWQFSWTLISENKVRLSSHIKNY